MTRRGRMAVGIGLVVAAIAVVVGLVAISGGDDAEPIAAVAAVQDDHLPVDPIETIPDRIEMVADTGVTTTRVDIFWGKVARTRPEDPRNPSDPAYDFSRPDLILQSFAARGITPIVSVYDTPDWASGGQTQPPGPLPVVTPDLEPAPYPAGPTAPRAVPTWEAVLPPGVVTWTPPTPRPPVTPPGVVPPRPAAP